jgi:hypothetical protein
MNEISHRPSPAAERMRRHRERQRDGLRCLLIELRAAFPNPQVSTAQKTHCSKH